VRRLYAGPWCGEFGWEICSWNPTIRHVAKGFDHVTVEIQPGHEYLYEFADEIIINPRKPDYDMYKGSPKKSPFQPPQGTTVIEPLRLWVSTIRKEFRTIKTADKGQQLHPKEWRPLGVEKPQKVVDVMCAFRGPKHFRGRSFPEKQYAEDKCITLVNLFLDAGYSVACYGGPDNIYVEGAVDLRGIPMIDLCGTLAETKLAVGPSSGTLHLSSLCGTPHVSWYGRPVVSMDRYLTYWNPFQAPVTFIDVSFPPPELVFKTSVARMDKDTPQAYRVKE